MAELDVEALQQQLEALKEQQHKAQQKLNDMKAARIKGRGPPGSMGERGFEGPHRPGAVFARLGPAAGSRGGPGQQRDGPPGRTSVFDRLYNNRASGGDSERSGADRATTVRNGPGVSRSSRDAPQLHMQGSRGDAEAEAAPNSTRQSVHSRLASRVVAPNGPAAGTSSSPHDEHDKEQEPAAAGAGRKRLLSAVMVNGEARTVSNSVDNESAEPEPPAKRPTLQTDARSKRRAQLMLGRMLVGTLQKAKDESEAFRSTAQRRQELERRAAEKAEAEAERLKEQERAARQQERHTQVCQLLDIEMQAKAKELEIKYAKIIQRKQKLLTFCVTKTQPPIYWLPREPADETAALLQEHTAAFQEWKQQQMQQLGSEKADLAALIASRKEKSALRLAGGPGQHDDDEQEEGEQAGEEREGDEGLAAAPAAAPDEDMLGGDRQQEEEEPEGAEQRDEQQSDKQQQQPEEADEEKPAAEAAAAVEAEHRNSRRRQCDSDDEEEERLLSSEDEDEL